MRRIWCGLVGVTIGCFGLGEGAIAQIVPDGTLGVERSNVIENFNGLPVELINGGARRGANIFHSFEQFNIAEGRFAYFLAPDASIQNILARVTGNSLSQILGVLGTRQLSPDLSFPASNATLFLMNPNGIIFGSNSRLDLSGSLILTSANRVLFPGQLEFSTVNPQAPPLLTISAPIGLQFGNQPGTIVNQSITSVTRDVQGNIIFNPGLQPGRTLAVLGGSIVFDGGNNVIQGGQLKFGAFSDNAQVEIAESNGIFNFREISNHRRSKIEFLNNAAIFVNDNSTLNLIGGEINFDFSGIIASDGSSINIIADQLRLSRGSQITSQTQGINKAGDIQIQVSGNAELVGLNLISNTSLPLAKGNSGSIAINSQNLILSGDGTLQGSPQILTLTSGGANTGNLILNTTESLVIDGGFVRAATDSSGNASDVLVESGKTITVKNGGLLGLARTSSGITGDLYIRTGTLKVDKGIVQNLSGPNSLGRSGSMFVQARDEIEIIDTIFGAGVLPGGQGQSGDINIETQRLRLQDGGLILTDTYGNANAGKILIRAADSVEIVGVSPKIARTSGISSGAGQGATGSGGDIILETSRLELKQGGKIDNGSVNAQSLAAVGERSGNITIRSKDIDLDGFGRFNTGNTEFVKTTISSQISGSSTESKGGNISVSTNNLRIRNGADISTAVIQGRGEAGNIEINALDTIEISGSGFTLQNGDPKASSLSTQLQVGSIGQGGTIKVETNQLDIYDGGGISASTSAQGNAGNILLKANKVSLNAGIINSQVEISGNGNAGILSLVAGELSLKDGGFISNSTAGIGDAGNIDIQTNKVIISSEKMSSGIASAVDATGNGKGGDIRLKTDDLLISGRGGIASRTLGEGGAGNIFIDASNIRMRDNARILADSRSPGLAGEIDISAKSLILSNGSRLSSETLSQNGGDITLRNLDIVLLRRGSFISTSAGTAQLGGNGGDVNLNSKFIIAVPKENSDIRANAFSGKGGNVRINTQGLFGITPLPRANDNLSDITASSELGTQGIVSILQPDVRPEQGVNELPTDLVDPTNQISKECPRGYTNRPMGSFIVTGKGGIPINPIDTSPPLTPLPPLISSNDNPPVSLSPIEPSQNQQSVGDGAIVEAQGWYRNKDGRIHLVAKSQTRAIQPLSTAFPCVPNS
jgi:filamentous hemagglutinin family protein